MIPLSARHGGQRMKRVAAIAGPRVTGRHRASFHRGRMTHIPQAPIAVAVGLGSGAQPPRIDAAGIGDTARFIRRVALRYGVRIIEDGPLAASLYDRRDAGCVPEDLYQPLAWAIVRAERGGLDPSQAAFTAGRVIGRDLR